MTRALLAQKHTELQIEQAQQLPPDALFPPAPPPLVEKAYNLGDEIGDNSTLALSIGREATLFASADLAKSHAGISTGVSIFGLKGDIFRMRLDATAPLTGSLTRDFRVDVLGTTVVSNNKNDTAAWNDNQAPFGQTWELETEFPFSLGPIPMSVAMGARGAVGVEWSTSVGPTRAIGLLVPYVTGTTYGEVAIDISIAEGGVYGNVTIVDGRQSVYAASSVSKFPVAAPRGHNTRVPTLRPVAFLSSYANWELKALAGELGVYAETYYPCDVEWKFGFIPWVVWCAARTEAELYSWPGYAWDGYFWNEHSSTVLASAS
jgi:hypothetical protein